MNRLVFDFLYGLSGRSAASDWLIKFAADYLGWVLVLILGWQLLRAVEGSRPLRPFVLMIAAAVASALFSLLIKTFYYRPRPFVVWPDSVKALLPHAADGSFPSTHAAVFLALAAAVLVYRRRLGWWYLGVAIVIGLSRVAAGLHSPFDILGGWLLGGALAACLIWLFRYNRRT